MKSPDHKPLTTLAACLAIIALWIGLVYLLGRKEPEPSDSGAKNSQTPNGGTDSFGNSRRPNEFDNSTLAYGGMTQADREAGRQKIILKIMEVHRLVDEGDWVRLHLEIERDPTKLFGDPAVVVPLLKDILVDETVSARVRASALDTLGRLLPREEVVPYVNAALQGKGIDSTEQHILQTAVWMAANLGMKEAIPHLEQILLSSENSPTARGSVVDALVLLDHKAAEGILTLALKDADNWELAPRVARGLARIGSYAAGHVLVTTFWAAPDDSVARMDKEDREIHRAVRSALRKLPTETLKMVVFDHLASVSPDNLEQRNKAVRLLQTASDLRADDEVFSFAQRLVESSTTPALQAQVFSLLGASNKPEAASILFDALDSATEPTAKLAALNALTRMSDADLGRLVGSVGPLLESEDAAVALGAARLISNDPKILAADPSIAAACAELCERFSTSSSPQESLVAAQIELNLLVQQPEPDIALIAMYDRVAQQSEGMTTAVIHEIGERAGGSQQLLDFGVQLVGNSEVSPDIRASLAFQISRTNYAAIQPTIIRELEHGSSTQAIESFATLLVINQPSDAATILEGIANRVSDSQKKETLDDIARTARAQAEFVKRAGGLFPGGKQ